MKWLVFKTYALLLFISLGGIVEAQGIKEKLSGAISKLQADDQFAHALVSLYVVDASSGNVLFAKNEQTGMVPASCQKVITSVTTFEFLGKDFMYKTQVGYIGEIKDSTLNGSLYIVASGDPTMGSWRWKHTKEEQVIGQLTASLKSKGIRKIAGGVYAQTQNWETGNTPGGWIWEDIGNYYGAGAAALNWRENQYDLVLKSGNNPGDKVAIVSVKPALNGVALLNELSTGAKGSGDNGYIYLPPFATRGFIRGTIPAGENSFVISGSFPDPVAQVITTITEGIKRSQISISKNEPLSKNDIDGNPKLTMLTTLQSPALDSINYWFLKRSVNLYGEAFVKTIAYQKKGYGATDSGIAIIKDFWSRRGVEKSALKIIDGSGLSPANRVTTHALVTVMQYARSRPWFASFFSALPEMNGIKMKDGYIGGVRSYTGFIKSRTGAEYTFAFIVNNFDGSPGIVREKMWKVLDLLK